MKKYYTLIEKLPGEPWYPQFGDFDKKVVDQERDYMKQSGTFVKGTKYMIITTPDGAIKEIVDAIDRLNNSIKKVVDAIDRLNNDADHEYQAGPYGVCLRCGKEKHGG